MSNVNTAESVDSGEHKLTELIMTCQTFMADNINTENCIRFWTVADKYNCSNLLEQARSYVCDHFVDVTKSQEFLRLDNRRLRELISRGELNDTLEDEILLSLIRWLQHEQRERAQFASGLVSLVRVPLLSSAFVVEHKDFIVDSIEDKTFIREIFKWHLMPNEKRPTMERNETLLVIMTESKSGEIQKYSHQNDEWTTWTQIEQNQNRINFGVATVDDELITAGGWYSEALNTVISTNLKTKTSKTLNPMGACQHLVSLVVLNNNIYAIGGWNKEWLRSVERLDCGTGQWKNVAPMNENREWPRAVVLNDRIYVIGSDTRTLECYDPVTNKWTLCASMLEDHDEPGVAVLKDHLYVVGGSRSITVERYNYQEDIWTKMCSLSSARGGLSCIAMKDCIFAVGGHNDFEGLSTVEEYEPIADVWTQKSDLKETGRCTLVLARDIP